MTVAHVITDLGPGGAQVMLGRLLPHLERLGIRNAVVSLGSRRAHGPSLPGARIEYLDAGSGLAGVTVLPRLQRALRAIAPDVVHTWLYHADLAGSVAAGRATPVVWGLHHVPYRGEPLKWGTRAVRRVNARLSWRRPSRIICCAHAARAAHVALGYRADRMVVIENGFDTTAHRPDPDARQALRRDLGLSPDVEIITMVARVHPHKDHRTFLEAAGRLASERAAVRFVLVGEGAETANAMLRGWIAHAGLDGRVHLAGHRDDVARFMAGSDLVTLASTSTEALPLVVGEAMACGVPCVASDVGDCRRLIGETGRVVPPRDAGALAHAWSAVLSLAPDARRLLGEDARRRVVAEYDLGHCAASYAAEYRAAACSSDALVSG